MGRPLDERRHLSKALSFMTALSLSTTQRQKWGCLARKLPEEVFPDQLKRLKEKGLIEIDHKEIRITKLGDICKGNIAWEFAARP